MHHHIRNSLSYCMKSISLDFICRKYDDPIHLNQMVVRGLDFNIPIFTWSIRNTMIEYIKYIGDNEAPINISSNTRLITMSALYCLYTGEKSTYKSSWYRLFVNKCDKYLGTFWWKGLRRIFHYNKWGVGVNTLTGK